MAVTVSDFAALSSLEVGSLDYTNPGFVAVGTSGTADVELVAGIPGRRIVVLGMALTASVTTALSMYSGDSADGDVILNPMGMLANLGNTFGTWTRPLFWCETGEALVSKVSINSVISGQLVYVTCPGV